MSQLEQASVTMNSSLEFINMQNPPPPKDSPYLAYIDKGCGGSPTNIKSVPYPTRRRSTNYVNTLRDKGLLREMEEVRTDVDKVSSKGDNNYTYGNLTSMSQQDMKHESSKYFMAGSSHIPPQFDKLVYMGDSIDYDGPRRQYMEAEDAMDPLYKGYNGKVYKRRPSFQYEDFKKDVYDKLHIFNDN